MSSIFATESIRTNSIDTITGALTIGGDNITQVNINEDVAISGTLTATTVTATGGITTPLPILLSYTTVPTFTSNQIGYQQIRTLTTTTANIATNTTTVVPFSTAISLGVGVWNISFGLRFISSGTTNITFYETVAQFGSAISIGGQTMPRLLNMTQYALTSGSFSVTSTENLAINDSITITNNVASNSLVLVIRIIYTGTMGSIISLLGATGGSVGPPVVPDSPNTYLIATRIG